MSRQDATMLLDELIESEIIADEIREGLIDLRQFINTHFAPEDNDDNCQYHD